MLGAIWAAIKAAAIGLVWWKQKSDQEQGKALLRGEDLGKTLEKTEEIVNSRNTPADMQRVHEHSQRTGE